MIPILPDKEKIELLQKIIRPPKWSHRSVAPYYKKKFALQIKAVLDLLLQNPDEPLMYYYKDYPDFSPDTLYNKFNQAKMYLIDNLDPDHKYRELNEALSIDRKRGVGIAVAIRKEVFEEQPQDGFLPRKIVEENKVHWRDKVHKFLEQGSVSKPFVLKGLALTPEEIEDLEIMLHNLGDSITFSVSDREITIIKL